MKYFALIFLYLFSTSLLATELKVSSISPSGIFSKQVKKIYIKFDQPLLALGQKASGFKKYIEVNGKTNCQLKLIGTSMLECKLPEALGDGNYTIKVKKGIGTYKKAKLKANYTNSIKVKVKTFIMKSSSNTGWGRRQSEERFMLASFNCYPKNETLSSYYEDKNSNLPVSKQIQCEANREVNFSLRGEIKDKTKLKEVFVPDSEFAKKANEQIIKNLNSSYYMTYLKFTTPKKEGTYSLTFSDSFLGYGKNNEKYLTPLQGSVHFILKVDPKAPAFKSRKGKLIYERDGDFKIPFQYVNLTGLKYSATREGEDKIFTGQYPLKSERNVAMRSFFDFEKALNLKKGKSHQIKLNLTTLDVADDIEASYITYGRSYRNDDSYNFKESKDFSIQTTNLGVHVKKGFFNYHVFVFSLDKGQPVSGAKIEIHGTPALLEGKTGRDGVALIKAPEYFEVSKVFVKKNDDQLTMDDLTQWESNWARGINPYDFNIPYQKLTKKNNFQVQVVPDRPLYRPGEEVNLKVFTRKWGNKFLETDKSLKEVKLTIRDSRREKLLEEKIKLNKYGTAVAKLKLKIDAKTGGYNVEVSNGDFSRRLEAFKVEEFRAPTIKVTTKATHKDKKVNLNGKAEYYFGGALKEADGEVIIAYKAKDFMPKQEELKKFFFSYDFEDYGYVSRSPFRMLKKEDISFDKKGLFNKSYNLEELRLEDYGELVFEINTKDANGAKVASRATIEVGDRHYVGSQSKEWSYEVGSKIKIDAVLMNAESKQIFGKKAKMNLYQRIYNTVRRKGAGNYYYYDYKVDNKFVSSCEFSFSQNQKTCQLKVKESGTYYYEIESLDKSIEFDKTKDYLYVWGGSGYASQRRFNHPRIDILMDKSEYKLGETAQILIKSPYDEAEAIITFERAGVMESKRIKLKGSMHQMEWDIDEDYYLPGFYVSVVIVKGRTSTKIEGNLDLGKPSFHIGYAKANVTSKISKLDVEVKVDEKSYKPKEEVEIEIEVEDHDGDDIQTELAVAVVDEAILDLVSGYIKKYDIHDKFYTLQNISVENFNSLLNLVGRQSYGKKGANAGGGGGLDPNMLRSNLKAVAYWNPQLETDDDGEATIKFKAPDNLTSWKVIVVAVDKNRRFGLGKSDFKVNKELMIEPALPNFLTEYDWFNGKFTVHNRSEKNLDIKFSLKSDEFLINKKEASQKVKKNEKAEILLPINVKGATKNYSLLAMAKGGGYEDAVLTKIPVVSLQSNNINVVSGTLNGKDVAQDIMVPKTAKEGTEKLTLSYATSRLGQLEEVFSYVLQYPYGCWEQKMSKAIFWGLYTGLEDKLDLKVDLEHDPKKVVQDFLDLAPKYQTEEGGFRYYPSNYGETSQYLSLYTAETFLTLEEMGFKIDKKVNVKLIGYLKKLLKSDSLYPRYYSSSSKSSLKAKLVSTLAAYKEKGWQSEYKKILRSNLKEYNLSSLAYLLQASQSTKDTKKIEKILDKNADVNEGYTIYNDPQDYPKYFLSTQMKSQCQIFSALQKGKLKNNEFFDKQINYIFSKRKRGRWYNTQENMYCFKAVYDYLKTEPMIKKPVTITASLDKKKVQTTKLESKTIKPVNEQISGLIYGKGQKLSLSPSNDKKVYYTMKLEYLDTADTQKNIDKGFEVNKYIYKMNPKKMSWESLDGELKLKRGDILKIVLTVKSDSDRYQVGIHDPLAGAFEPINFNLDNTSLTSKLLKDSPKDKRYKQTKYEYFSDYFYGNGFHFADLRLQAVQFYADELRKNRTYRVEYAVSVIATGKFLIDATKVEEMYYPDVYGMTKTTKVKVTE